MLEYEGALGAIDLEENYTASWKSYRFWNRPGLESGLYFLTVWVPSESDSKIGILVQVVYLGGTGDTGSGVRK